MDSDVPQKKILITINQARWYEEKRSGKTPPWKISVLGNFECFHVRAVTVVERFGLRSVPNNLELTCSHAVLSLESPIQRCLCYIGNSSVGRLGSRIGGNWKPTCSRMPTKCILLMFMSCRKRLAPKIGN